MGIRVGIRAEHAGIRVGIRMNHAGVGLAGRTGGGRTRTVAKAKNRGSFSRLHDLFK